MRSSPNFDDSSMFKMTDEDVESSLQDTNTFPRDRTGQPVQILHAQSLSHVSNRISNRRGISMSPIVIVGDSMVRNVYILERELAGQVGVLPFPGVMAAELFCYLEAQSPSQLEALIINVELINCLRGPEIRPHMEIQSFEVYMASVLRAFETYEPKVIFLCTLINVPGRPGFQEEADQFNGSVHALARARKRIIVLEIEQKLTHLSGNVPNLFCPMDNTHQKHPEGMQLMVVVMVAALDFCIRDEEEISRNKRLVGTEHKSNLFSSTYTRDYHNILRRSAQVVSSVPVQQDLQLPEVVMSCENEARMRAEPWHVSPNRASPYDASHQGESPDVAPTLNPELFIFNIPSY